MILKPKRSCIMKFGFGTGSYNGHSVKDLPGFYKANRFIVLTSVTSNTIPNILDMVFNLLPGGTSRRRKRLLPIGSGSP